MTNVAAKHGMKGIVLEEVYLRALTHGPVDVVLPDEPQIGQEYGILSLSTYREMQSKGQMSAEIYALAEFARALDINDIDDIRRVATAFNQTLADARGVMVELAQRGQSFYRTRFAPTDTGSHAAKQHGKLDS